MERMREPELERMPVMTWTARPDMSCAALSREWLAYTGYDEAQALGDGWSRGIHPDDLGRWLDTCVRAFDAREPFEIEYRLRRHDGEYRWMLDRGVPRHAPDGRFLDRCLRAFDEREPFEIEYRLRRHDGEYRWVLDRAVPRYSRDGHFIGYVGCCIDIDDRKRAEDELARSLERERRLRVVTDYFVERRSK